MKSQQHGGQILRRVIAESGYKIKDVAKQAGMSRGGLYLQFKKEKINYKTLAQIGKVLKYDFNQLFATLEKNQSDQNTNEESRIFNGQTIDDSLIYQKKYTLLLERYNKLLFLLIDLANRKNDKKLQKEIESFLKDEKAL